MTVSLINDPSDFVPGPTELKGKKWAKWFEGGEPLTSLVSEAIDYVVHDEINFVIVEVAETAAQRARRIWRMKEPIDVH